MGLKIIKRFTPEAKALIQKLSPNAKKALRSLSDELLSNPELGKELKDQLKGFRSARYTRYRIIYEYREKENMIVINYLGARKDVYRLFEKHLRQLNENK